MSDIQFLDNEILINGVSSTTVAKTLKDSGLKNAAIAEIIGGWFVGVTGEANPAAFNFVTDVDTPDPNCSVTYTRSFSHSDWIDGESRVQAGMTPEELGFNARFHALENEFNAIAAQFAKSGNCISELRKDLIGIADELEAKITALQNSIHETTPPIRTGPDIIGPVKFGDQTGLLTKFGDDFQVMKYETMASKFDPKVHPVAEGAGVFVPNKAQPEVVVNVIKGLRGTVETDDGLKGLFSGGKNPTVGDIRTNAPNVTLPSGESLGSVLATMPADTKFTDANDAIAKITEHVVGQLNKTQTTKLRGTVVTGEHSDRTGTSLLNSGVAVLGVNETVATALGSAGLGTVSKLSGASTLEITNALTSAGLDAQVAHNTAADILAKANVTKALRNF